MCTQGETRDCSLLLFAGVVSGGQKGAMLLRSAIGTRNSLGIGANKKFLGVNNNSSFWMDC